MKNYEGSEGLGKGKCLTEVVLHVFGVLTYVAEFVLP